MIELLLVCSAILIIILLSEWLLKTKRIHTETSRKIISIGTGVVVAFLPFFISWRSIQLLSVAFLVVILVSYRFHIFRAIHGVKRVTIGELLYPLAIGICALLEPAPWMFTAAILHLAVADSVAAMVGHRWGHNTRYTIISHGKSMVGSLTFFWVSFGIFFSLLLFVLPSSLPAPFLLLLFCPAALTLIENISWYGLDDVTVPIAVIVLLSGLPT